jgi:hypothetical protein
MKRAFVMPVESLSRLAREDLLSVDTKTAVVTTDNQQPKPNDLRRLHVCYFEILG